MTATPATAAPPSQPSRWTAWTTSPLALRRLAAASVIVNVLIIVTGGAVRLSNSGLGCPTWPACSGSDPIPSHEFGVHKAIEFGNRTLTFVVAAVLFATLVAAWRQHRGRALALIAFLGVPAQAVLGGIVVLTNLNPWLVAPHFLLSEAIVAVTALLWWRLSEQGRVEVAAAARYYARGLVAITALVLALGTLVTGTGPHAGDPDKNGRVHRIHLSTSGVTQLHADAVMGLVGLTIGMLVLAIALRADRRLTRAAAILLAIELAQGIVGYSQYFLHVPALLVGFHMFGACLVWLAALQVLFLIEARTTRMPQKS